jgi:hypothetical protein
MTTKKQIEANQENALRSTGAVTQEGKVIVSRNAIKHGIFARDLMLKTEVYQENEDEYRELLHGLVDSLMPQGQMENLLVEKIALDFWRLRRVIRFETGSIKRYLEEVIDDYYDRWRSGEKHLSLSDIEERIEERQSSIDWSKQYLASLRQGTVKFDQPLWEGEEIESDIEDDLHMIANRVDRELITEDERMDLKFGELDLSALKEIIGRAGYHTDQAVADRLIEIYSKLNEEYEKEIADLNEQKIVNARSDELKSKLCSLPPNDNFEKVLKYETSIQKSIFQNLIMLKKLQCTL